MNGLIKSIQLWAKEKGLLDTDPKAQYMKMSEELGEVAQAYTRNQTDELEADLR